MAALNLECWARSMATGSKDAGRGGHLRRAGTAEMELPILGQPPSIPPGSRPRLLQCGRCAGPRPPRLLRPTGTEDDLTRPCEQRMSLLGPAEVQRPTLARVVAAPPVTFGDEGPAKQLQHGSRWGAPSFEGGWRVREHRRRCDTSTVEVSHLACLLQSSVQATAQWPWAGAGLLSPLTLCAVLGLLTDPHGGPQPQLRWSPALELLGGPTGRVSKAAY